MIIKISYTHVTKWIQKLRPQLVIENQFSRHDMQTMSIYTFLNQKSKTNTKINQKKELKIMENFIKP